MVVGDSPLTPWPHSHWQLTGFVVWGMNFLQLSEQGKCDICPKWNCLNSQEWNLQVNGWGRKCYTKYVHPVPKRQIPNTTSSLIICWFLVWIFRYECIAKNNHKKQENKNRSWGKQEDILDMDAVGHSCYERRNGKMGGETLTEEGEGG